MKININLNIKVGRIVKYFVLSDLFLMAGRGFVDPIFSVFVVQKIPGATLTTIGIVTGIYFVIRSLLQIPVANYLDKTAGEKDDFLTLIIGLFIAGFCPLALLWVNQIWELYVVQSVLAVAFALYFASWSPIFSRHLDKDRIAFDWSLDSVVIGIASGITGFLGGLIAEIWGYPAVFISGSVLSFIAAFVLLAAPDLVFPRATTTKITLEKKPTTDASIQ